MSRVAKQPIEIPAGVTVALKGNDVEIKGPKGTLQRSINNVVSITESTTDSDAKVLNVAAKDGSNNAKAQSGTARALLNNMVVGVSAGFEKTLELVGVGYRAQVQGQKVNLSLGFSHPIDYQLPEGVTAETPNNTTLLLKSIDKQKLGQTAAEIRAFRPPEPYKGKGIRYLGERIIRKETKKK